MSEDIARRICWECPLYDGIPICDPTRARCPEPPLSVEEQERIAQFFDCQSRWLIHGDAS